MPALSLLVAFGHRLVRNIFGWKEKLFRWLPRHIELLFHLFQKATQSNLYMAVFRGKPFPKPKDFLMPEPRSKPRSILWRAEKRNIHPDLFHSKIHFLPTRFSFPSMFLKVWIFQSRLLQRAQPILLLK